MMKFAKDDYLHERCHIFALALHDFLGYPIEFFWDTAAILDDGKRIGQALIHAYVVNPNSNHCIDVRGKTTKEEIEKEYDWNCPIYRRVTIEEVQGYMACSFLDPPQDGELEELRRYIQEHKEIYQ
jgi:hypothetical protein